MSSKIANWHFTMAVHRYMVTWASQYASCRVHKSFLCFILAKAMWLRLKLIRANTMPIRQFFGENILFFRRDKSGCLNTMCVDGSYNKHIYIYTYSRTSYTIFHLLFHFSSSQFSSAHSVRWTNQMKPYYVSCFCVRLWFGHRKIWRIPILMNQRIVTIDYRRCNSVCSVKRVSVTWPFDLWQR